MKYVLDELAMDQGRALLNAAKESDANLIVNRDGRGYIGQEVDRLMEIANAQLCQR